MWPFKREVSAEARSVAAAPVDDTGPNTQALPGGGADTVERTHHIRCSLTEIRGDASRQVVYGEVYVPFDPMPDVVYPVEQIVSQVDSWGTFMRPSTIEHLAHRYLQWSRNVDTQHDRLTVGGVPVESFIARPNDPEFTPGAWVMAVKVPPDVWPRVVAGEFTGFSIDVLAGRRQHAIRIQGSGTVPDLNGVVEPPYPANLRDVEGETTLRLDELVDPVPFFVSLVDKAATLREFELRAQLGLKPAPVVGAASPSPQVRIDRDQAASAAGVNSAPQPVDVVAIGAAKESSKENPMSVPAETTTPTTQPDSPATEVKPRHVRAAAHEKRASVSLLPQGMGAGASPIDFAQAWAIEDVSEDLCDASMLLRDCLFSIYANPNAYADNQALFDGVVKVLNDYATAVEELLLGARAGDGTSEQRAGIARRIGRRLAQMITLRKKTLGGGQVEVRVGRKVSAARLEKLKTALNSIADVIAEGEVDGVEISEDPENDTSTEKQPSNAKPQIATSGSDAAQGSPSADKERTAMKQPPQIDTTGAQSASGDADRDPDKQRADGDAETPDPEPSEDDDMDSGLAAAIAALAQKLDALNAQIGGLESVSDRARATPDAQGDAESDSVDAATPAANPISKKKPAVSVANRATQDRVAGEALRSIEEKISRLGERVSRIENVRRASAQAQLGASAPAVASPDPNNNHDDEVFRGVLTRGLEMPMRLGEAVRRAKPRDR